MEKAHYIMMAIAIVAIVGIGISGYWGFLFGQKTVPETTIQPGSVGGFAVEPVIWDNPEKPMQSWNLKDLEIPAEAIVIEISAKGYSPSSFTVKNNQKVILVLKNIDIWSHTLNFEDKNLSSISLSAGAGKVTAITFFAPQKIGEYPFYCLLPRHFENGEQGKMIVQ